LQKQSTHKKETKAKQKMNNNNNVCVFKMDGFWFLKEGERKAE
jgi:hypothetical protein